MHIVRKAALRQILNMKKPKYDAELDSEGSYSGDEDPEFKISSGEPSSDDEEEAAPDPEDSDAEDRLAATFHEEESEDAENSVDDDGYDYGYALRMFIYLFTYSAVSQRTKVTTLREQTYVNGIYAIFRQTEPNPI